MKRMIKMVTLAMALTMAASGIALATPSTQIWIPSTDIQAYKTLHLGIDNYVRTSKNGPVANNVYDIGLTAGVLPWEKLQAEIGIDYIDGGTNAGADAHPLYFNAKVGTPEDSLFKYSPALAVGIYNVGTQTGGVAPTKQNMVYGLLARTLPVIGRVSAGGYHGSSTVLVDENGKSANDGVLLSWDRTMSEISDKLWMAVDYQSGNSALGALNFGVSWAFSKNVSVIFGYDIYNNVKTGGTNTFTTQLDINFP
ncbi:MAG TPA: hypothetical protein VK187_02660 [Geobacteraceae bacterium]|nr:hypothetical protein [Geobacteraceae bacterium]